ncbi:helix-turn-helix transcriptional regulator [Novosphingobium sp. Gsoil 351]|uniref:helix-turn-helix transcriptional regulator n=1 Tax=Novosphingobium sp. Gsoil 351 TaxID=2675225 RepID=UPI0012B49B9E|nr:AraC family transcriptional regulator [Novosphingobium sp. Gsoil 351]QGN53958.1 helix-turn-helix domain-containing protein [Novosphingobium sp. Gsoil 351]
MTALIGRGTVGPASLPADPVVFAFSGFDSDDMPMLTFRPNLSLDRLQTAALVFVVARAACARLYPDCAFDAGTWHMTSALREQAAAILSCEASGEARATLRLARSIELLCKLHFAKAAGELVPMRGDGMLDEFDLARVVAARRIVDDGWQSKLTIADLSRQCGINRDKLVRGFRQAYGATIGEALSERRLGEARTMLLTSDLQVASIGYRCGYLNNASFTRAFTRRFGLAPSALRRTGLAA